MALLFVQISVSVDGYNVLTHDALNVAWEQSQAVQLADLARIKREATRPIALFAGAAAACSALTAGVVDELRLIRYPVLLGKGKPLFDDQGERHHLSLTEQRRLNSGALVSRYTVRKSPV